MFRTWMAISRLEAVTAIHVNCINNRVIPHYSSNKIALIHRSSPLGKKGGSKSSKKGASKNNIDKFLDELSDDEDENIVPAQVQPDVAMINPNSPVNKFLKNRPKSMESFST